MLLRKVIMWETQIFLKPDSIEELSDVNIDLGGRQKIDSIQTKVPTCVQIYCDVIWFEVRQRETQLKRERW